MHQRENCALTLAKQERYLKYVGFSSNSANMTRSMNAQFRKWGDDAPDVFLPRVGLTMGQFAVFKIIVEAPNTT